MNVAVPRPHPGGQPSSGARSHEGFTENFIHRWWTAPLPTDVLERVARKFLLRDLQSGAVPTSDATSTGRHDPVLPSQLLVQ